MFLELHSAKKGIDRSTNDSFFRVSTGDSSYRSLIASVLRVQYHYTVLHVLHIVCTYCIRYVMLKQSKV